MLGGIYLGSSPLGSRIGAGTTTTPGTARRGSTVTAGARRGTARTAGATRGTAPTASARKGTLTS